MKWFEEQRTVQPSERLRNCEEFVFSIIGWKTGRVMMAVKILSPAQPGGRISSWPLREREKMNNGIGTAYELFD
ncbi:MAG: hypothetical protein WAL90_18875 [Desulfobacterales bacterium]